MIFSRLLQSITFPIIISASLVSCGYDLVTFGNIQADYQSRYNDANASYKQYILTATPEQKVLAESWFKECSNANSNIQSSCVIFVTPYCDQDSTANLDTATGNFDNLMANRPFSLPVASQLPPYSSQYDYPTPVTETQTLQYENQNQQGIMNTVVPVIPPG